MRLLVIEDEIHLLDQIVNRLKKEGYAVDSAVNGEEGFYFGNEYPIDAAIVDLGLPDISGISVIQRLRKNGKDFPILILTARGRWQDKVTGLESGADDYLAKPFHMEELLARIRALIRRASGQSHPVLHYGPVSLDTRSNDVTVNGVPIELTAFEYKILEYLMLHAGEVISKTRLTEHIYAEDFDRDSNVIEVFIRRLRRKLDPDNRIQPIETLRGRGYRFSLEQTQA
jgi:two-component system response regulator PhoP